ncbi:7TM GPCR protein [Aphelenchoides avenae]|nr:7TM GPCR protein [Aphelenchus avenae]
MSDSDIDIEKAWFSGFDFKLCQVTRNVNAVLSSASNLLAIYIMVRHSPSHMKTYRWFLMNTVVWSWLWDFFATELFAPHPTLPAQGVCVLGFLRVAGFYGTIVCFVIMIHLVGGCVMSVLCAAAFRLAAVYNVQDVFATKRGYICVAVLHNCMCAPVYVAAAFVVPVVVANQPQYVREASKFTGVANVIKDHACTFASFDDPAWQVSIVVTTVSIVVAVLIASGIFVACGVALWSRRKKMSAKTYKMHRNLIVSLSVQASC